MKEGNDAGMKEGRVEKEGKKDEGISRLVWREVVRKADG